MQGKHCKADGCRDDPEKVEFPLEALNESLLSREFSA